MIDYSAWILAIFVLGYLSIIFEHVIGINKATSALFMAIGCWAVQFANLEAIEESRVHFAEHLANVSQIVLFLMGAIAIVETIHAHGGFSIVVNAIRIKSKRSCLWIVGLIAFFLSSVLDNLTTTIVMCVMLKKLLEDTDDRLLFGSTVVIAANAGGAWTPIGDVTTTMLWLGGQVTSSAVVRTLFLPSIACLLGSLVCLTFLVRGALPPRVTDKKELLEPKGNIVFICGVLALIFVPVFKYLTGLPPFMGILFSMSFIWLLTDLLHRNFEDRDHLRFASILPRVDLSSIFFFLGILLSVNALETAGILSKFSVWMDTQITTKELLPPVIGIISAVIDNVPLVAACMGMYGLESIPQDSLFWLLTAFCAGTGGSLLIIGSAAGVAFMGLEKVDFFWYLRKVTIAAFVGYVIGILLFFFML
jgi:Na+/H+ antiporter NhaD/arsenite permease-like protein